MPSEKHHILPVWFFVGVLFVIYGILIVISGLTEQTPPDVAQVGASAPIWWGAIMLAVGLIYTIAFRPKKS